MAKASKTPGQVLKRALPGRMQVQLHHYERARRVFRPVPAHAITVDVATATEARRLFAAVRALVDAGGWRDRPGGAPDDGGDSVGPDVVHGPTHVTT